MNRQQLVVAFLKTTDGVVSNYNVSMFVKKQVSSVIDMKDIKSS